ncbi:MAG TPA: DEAD/DEAH box helicase [Mucilaginibacter sp.]|jgi:hypothetical protein
MKPENQSITLLSVTRSRAKMFEYSVPEQFHISIPKDPAELLLLTVGMLGDYGSLEDGEEGNILFSAQYFDSYVESRLNDNFNNYLLLIGSAAYYLCDLPGSSAVLAKRLEEKELAIEGDGLEYLLINILLHNVNAGIESLWYKKHIDEIINLYKEFYINGIGLANLIKTTEQLRKDVYEYGNARHLLLADTVLNVIKKQAGNSTWNMLPLYSALSVDLWKETISKPLFIREFWPAQKMLGEKGVFNGRSAVIQMPTSAGKTKSIEIIIRSSFLSSRAKLAVVVAPFKALCSEIKGSLQASFAGESVKIDVPSDIFQVDFDVMESTNFNVEKLILILTPEKFIYMIRHQPEIADEIGLLVYDEGHQFDNGLRGITYELLLSSLRMLVPLEAQVVLISAVISNAQAIGDWLIGENKEVINGTNLLPTYRTIAFASWKAAFGRLEFVKPDDPDTDDFFVPRVLQQIELARKKGESKTKKRFFPMKEDGKSIAIYLGLRLIQNGAVAIFCGSKGSVKSIYESIVDLYIRGYNEQRPFSFSNKDECNKIGFLHKEHFGAASLLTQSCYLGIFAHSGNTPHGIRLAIEYAMQQSKIKFIICTSTLAQGINMPIKYLLVTGFYQAGEKIKTRDFHNLIGRAGRSGIHTEGSIIFTDPDVYDQKNSTSNSWKWSVAKELLDPANAEPCTSTLLTIFDSLLSDDQQYRVDITPLKFVEAYLEGGESVRNLPVSFASDYAHHNFSVEGLTNQINKKINIIAAIESYLMAHWDVSHLTNDETGIVALAQGTLAYFLSDQEQKNQLTELFVLLAKNVETKINTLAKRIAYGKTLFGVQDLMDIEKWTFDHIDALRGADSTDGVLDLIWDILFDKISNGKLKKLTPNTFNLVLLKLWITGAPYLQLLTFLENAAVKITAGTKKRKLTQELIVEITENAFAYDATLIVAAITEVLKVQNHENNRDVISSLNILQKKIKYGLPINLAIAFYEIGFADRVIAMDLARNLGDFSADRSKLVIELKENIPSVLAIVEKYPSYFEWLIRNL